MANFGALNNIIKLQKMLRSLNLHSSILHSSSCASVVLLQNQRVLLLQQKRKQLQPVNSSSRHTSTSGNSASSSIDEFRKREEEREREFARRQADAEVGRKHGNNEDPSKKAKLDVIRTKILDAALLHVPLMGWTRQALVQGAEEIGFPSVVHGMFPEGGYALVSHFYGKCNEALVQRLQADTNNGQKAVSDPVSFLVSAVRERLEMITPYKAQWPQAQALIALPPNAATSLAQLLTLVDDICYYSGDRSVDIGWYTRRIGLATIMKLTELYMLTDSSPQHAKTWEFLQHRMDEAVHIESVFSQSDNVTQSLQSSFNSAFITARNILGLNYNRL